MGLFGADDRICPSCQVLLPEGRTVCPKCGRKVEPQRTGIGFIDVVRKIRPSLVDNLGSFWGNVVALALLLILFAIAVGIAFFIKFVRTYITVRESAVAAFAQNAGKLPRPAFLAKAATRVCCRITHGHLESSGSPNRGELW